MCAREAGGGSGDGAEVDDVVAADEDLVEAPRGRDHPRCSKRGAKGRPGLATDPLMLASVGDEVGHDDAAGPNAGSHQAQCVAVGDARAHHVGGAGQEEVVDDGVELLCRRSQPLIGIGDVDLDVVDEMQVAPGDVDDTGVDLDADDAAAGGKGPQLSSHGAATQAQDQHRAGQSGGPQQAPHAQRVPGIAGHQVGGMPRRVRGALDVKVDALADPDDLHAVVGGLHRLEGAMSQREFELRL